MSDDAVVRGLYRRVMMMVGRGRLRTINDTGSAQTAQIDLGPLDASGNPLMLRDNTPVITVFGLASNPPLGADATALFLGGDHNKAVVIGHNHQTSRMKNLGSGDSALYDVRGVSIWLTANGPVINANGLPVTINGATEVTINASSSPGVTLNCDLKVNGKITATEDVVAGAISLQQHVHAGVTAGGAETGLPTG